MNFVIITHVQHVKKHSEFFGYAPYINEMNIWLKYVKKVTIVAPIEKAQLNNLHVAYQHNNLIFKEVPSFNLTSFLNKLQTIIKLPFIFWTIFLAMKNADHIHLRCPGNMGLLGCFIQILFPNIPKTAKYAGNWDPNAKQPLSYKIQKWILNNTFLTKNMLVLVYGEWEGSSKNIKPFFTATYSENRIKQIVPKDLNCKINFIFVGTLSIGKMPLYAVQLIEKLTKKGVNAQLTIYGDGVLKNQLESYVQANNLVTLVFLKGNQNKKTIEQAYQDSHFLVLPSKSEGWPKVVAESMFWGCLPLTTNVSCVNYMIGNGNRGKLLNLNFTTDLQMVLNLIEDEPLYIKMCNEATNWSQQFTVEYFENEIVKLLKAS